MVVCHPLSKLLGLCAVVSLCLLMFAGPTWVQGDLWPRPLSAELGGDSVKLCSTVELQVIQPNGPLIYPGDQKLLESVTGSFSEELLEKSRGGSGGSRDTCWSTILIDIKKRGFFRLYSLQHPFKAHRPFAEAELERLFESKDTSVPLGFNEGYVLESDETIRQHELIVRLSTDSVWGVIRGLQTLRQLISPKTRRLTSTPFVIADQPALAHRSILIDCTRYYYPIATLQHIVAYMGNHAKMNVLHLHLTDDQSFMLQIRGLPSLAKSLDALHAPPYTQQEMRHLVDFAARVGVRIVPEIGMPGHAASWVFSNLQPINQTGWSSSLLSAEPPEAAGSGSLVSRLRQRLREGREQEHANDLDDVQIVSHCPKYACGSEGWSIPLDPTKRETYQVIERVLDEVHELFPDPFWHLGGDETSHSGGCWSEAESTRAFQPKELIARFQEGLLEILRRRFTDRVNIFWEEAWDEAGKDYASNPFNVLNVWRTWDQKSKTLMEKLRPRDNHWVIQSGYWYPFDCLSPTHCLQLSPFDRIPGTQLLGGEISFWEWSVEHMQAHHAMSKASAVGGRMWTMDTAAAHLVSMGVACQQVHSNMLQPFPEHYCQIGQHPSKPEFYAQPATRDHWNFLKCLTCKRIDPLGKCTPRTAF